jgi:hypothetical protein
MVAQEQHQALVDRLLITQVVVVAVQIRVRLEQVVQVEVDQEVLVQMGLQEQMVQPI